MKSSKPIIGLCGGIGAGKSQVAGEFERQGCLVIASDRLNHAVLAEPGVLAVLRGWWGGGVVAADGGPDRARIAAIIFADAAEKQRLESLVYPLIAQKRMAMIRAVEDNSAIKAIVIDSPLLLESNLDRECDTVVYVDAGEAVRLRRLQEQRGWDAQELKRREAWQMPPAEKRGHAEFIIDNDGPPEQLPSQVADILTTILDRHARGRLRR